MTRDKPAILVITNLEDVHSRAVIWALRQAGYDPAIFGLSHFPADVAASIHVGRSSQAEDWQSFDAQLFARAFDVAWYRRRPVVVPSAELSPADVKFVRAETERFLHSAVASIEAKLWVNSPEARTRADDKVRQLRVARSLGFAIPETLVSNSPRDVRAFVSRHRGQVVHKAFIPMSWKDGQGGSSHAHTQLLPPESELRDDEIALCPGIYQQAIPKRHELRVTVFGDEVHALLIESQKDRPTSDWRIDVNLGLIDCRSRALDAATAERCRRLCRALGLAFGAIDLIVAPSGETIFIEVNEAGNFLFYDSLEPGFGMLQAFCAFLAGDGGDVGRFPRFQDFLKSDAFKWQPKALTGHQQDHKRRWVSDE
ncbi:MAG: RimK family alpha-L-glutamate ligase [Allosphingosinicella sp.]